METLYLKLINFIASKKKQIITLSTLPPNFYNIETKITTSISSEAQKIMEFTTGQGDL